jgi:hypothetical protein
MEQEEIRRDRLMAHPVHGANHWVCVLNPSHAALSEIEPLVQEAYAIARPRAERVQDRPK